MGLLDDAIREHLELKRRSGADPEAVEREELEALAPVYPDEGDPPGAEDHGLTQAPDAGAAHGEFVSGDVAFEGHSHDDPRLANLGGVGQETAEIDMRAVLEEGAYVPDAATPVGPIGPVGGGLNQPSSEGAPEDQSFEWEQPDASDNGSVPEEIPGQERLSFE